MLISKYISSCISLLFLNCSILYYLTFFFLIISTFNYYLFIFGCVGSSFLCEGFLQLRQAGASPHRGAQASHRRGLSYCGAQAPDAQAQQLWLTGPVAPRHVGSPQTRARTHVPCISRQILNHCATREALPYFFNVTLHTVDIMWSFNIPKFLLSNLKILFFYLEHLLYNKLLINLKKKSMLSYTSKTGQ